jgi:hypothetical protein
MRRSIIGFALLLVVAGCGSDPKAEPSPSPSSPVTSPVSTTPSPPVMPDAAKANTKAGAIAFVRHYIEVFNFAQATGSSSDLSALSSQRCQECTATINALEQIYDSAGHIEGGALMPRAFAADHNSAEDMWVVLARIDSGPQSVVTSPTSSPTTLPGGRRSMSFSVVQERGGWKVRAWSRA